MIIKLCDNEYANTDYISLIEITILPNNICRVYVNVGNGYVTPFKGSEEECRNYCEKLVNQINKEKLPRGIIDSDGKITRIN